MLVSFFDRFFVWKFWNKYIDIFKYLKRIIRCIISIFILLVLSFVILILFRFFYCFFFVVDVENIEGCDVKFGLIFGCVRKGVKVVI